MAVSRMMGMSVVSRSIRQSDSPSSPGIMMSRTTRSMALALRSRRISWPPSAAETRMPFLARYLASGSRISAESSTMRMCGEGSILRAFRGDGGIMRAAGTAPAEKV
jgi:hypothetical protein